MSFHKVFAVSLLGIIALCKTNNMCFKLNKTINSNFVIFHHDNAFFLENKQLTSCRIYKKLCCCFYLRRSH